MYSSTELRWGQSNWRQLMRGSSRSSVGACRRLDRDRLLLKEESKNRQPREHATFRLPWAATATAVVECHPIPTKAPTKCCVKHNRKKVSAFSQIDVERTRCCVIDTYVLQACLMSHASCLTLTEQPFTEADDPLPPTVRVTLSLRPPSSKGTPKRSSTCDAHGDGDRQVLQESATLILTTFICRFRVPLKRQYAQRLLLCSRNGGRRTASLLLGTNRYVGSMAC